MMLVDEAGEAFDNEALLNGELTPVFFWVGISKLRRTKFLKCIR